MTEDLKTPEQLAEEYADLCVSDAYYAPLKAGFLAGYQAGQEAMLDAQSRMDSAFDRMLQRAKGNSPKKSNSWISVKERLPDNGDCVLVYRNNIAEISIALALFDYWQIWGVTHWMPLPEPPKHAWEG